MDKTEWFMVFNLLQGVWYKHWQQSPLKISEIVLDFLFNIHLFAAFFTPKHHEAEWSPYYLFHQAVLLCDSVECWQPGFDRRPWPRPREGTKLSLCLSRAGCSPWSHPLIPALSARAARDADKSMTSVRGEETSIILPGFQFLPIPVVAFSYGNKQILKLLPLTQPKQQASGWCRVPLPGKRWFISIPIPIFSPRREQEETSDSGTGGAPLQSLCCY